MDAASPPSVFLFYILGFLLLNVLYEISSREFMRQAISHERLQICILILGFLVTLRQQCVTISFHFQSILEYCRSVHVIISEGGILLLVLAPQYLAILFGCYLSVIVVTFQIWRPAIRRIKTPTLIEHTPAAWWAYDERIVINSVKVSRQQRQEGTLIDVEGAKTGKKGQGRQHFDVTELGVETHLHDVSVEYHMVNNGRERTLYGVGSLWTSWRPCVSPLCG